MTSGAVSQRDSDGRAAGNDSRRLLGAYAADVGALAELAGGRAEALAQRLLEVHTTLVTLKRELERCPVGAVLTRSPGEPLPAPQVMQVVSRIEKLRNDIDLRLQTVKSGLSGESVTGADVAAVWAARPDDTLVAQARSAVDVVMKEAASLRDLRQRAEHAMQQERARQQQAMAEAAWHEQRARQERAAQQQRAWEQAQQQVQLQQHQLAARERANAYRRAEESKELANIALFGVFVAVPGLFLFFLLLAMCR